jgi:tetratricopeptide (TPR) repeat protein
MLFQDALFAAPSERVAAEDVFALSDEMRRYIDTQLADSLRSKGFERGLVDALYKRSQLKLEYDSKVTRNAAQAFAARSGNCLSLVIMTAAFAKALDVPVTYQSAYADETWSRSGGLYFRTGHVNIQLGRRLIDRGSGETTRLMIDFLPANELQGLRTTPISEARVVAMFMNNRAAEALTRGEVDAAYWWARAAMDRGDYRAARDLFSREVDRASYNADFQYWLGLADFRLGDVEAARKHLALAMESSATRDERDLYAAKLAWLRSYRRQ